MYWLNYLDRNAIALARLNDLEEELGLDSTQYQTCVSILFVGYLLGQIPSNMFLTRTRPSTLHKSHFTCSIETDNVRRSLHGLRDDALGHC